MYICIIQCIENSFFSLFDCQLTVKRYTYSFFLYRHIFLSCYSIVDRTNTLKQSAFVNFLRDFYQVSCTIEKCVFSFKRIFQPISPFYLLIMSILKNNSSNLKYQQLQLCYNAYTIYRGKISILWRFINPLLQDIFNIQIK